MEWWSWLIVAGVVLFIIFLMFVFILVWKIITGAMDETLERRRGSNGSKH